MDILIYGTVNSVTFALIAVGFTLVYGVSRLPNFAHGALYVLVGFLTWSLVNDFKLFYPLAILISLVIVSLLGAVIYRVVLIRLRGLPTSEIIASFAVGLIILEGLRLQGWRVQGFIGPFMFSLLLTAN
jgi:branched-chain amino acid transport system permease protein